MVHLADEIGTDYTFLINGEKLFFTLQELQQELAGKLSVPKNDIDIEDV